MKKFTGFVERYVVIHPMDKIIIIINVEATSKDNIISKTCGVDDWCRLFFNHQSHLTYGNRIFVSATRFAAVVVPTREKICKLSLDWICVYFCRMMHL